MPDHDQIEIDLLRSALARAYEKRESFPFTLVKAVRNYIGLRIARQPIIESLNIIEKEQRRGLGTFSTDVPADLQAESA